MSGETQRSLELSCSSLRPLFLLVIIASIVIRVRGIVCVVSSIVSFSNHKQCLEGFRVSPRSILGFHSRDETAMLVYKTMAKCRSGLAQL